MHDWLLDGWAATHWVQTRTGKQIKIDKTPMMLDHLLAECDTPRFVKDLQTGFCVPAQRRSLRASP